MNTLTDEQLKWLRYTYQLVRKQRDTHRASGDEATAADLTNALAGLLLVSEDALT